MLVDTRRFTTPHVHANFDFDGSRGFDTSLNFHLPEISHYTGRDVRYGARRFELWSPNSFKLPIYPGTKPPRFSLVPPLTHRRTDGSGGRFDWTLVPQYLDTNLLHHPFILDPELVQRPVPPEFTYLTRVWESSGSSRGRLTREFYHDLLSRAEVLENRRLAALPYLPVELIFLATIVSVAPSAVSISAFESDMSWEECVEGLTHIQRLLREKDAWLRMTRALRQTAWSMGNPADVRSSSIGPANDTVLGAWVNGADERVVMWFLRLGVPCFIIHEYREGLDFGHGVPEHRSRDCTVSFCPPIIWHLLDQVNAYKAIALRNAAGFVKEAPAPSYGPNVKVLPDALARSSSHVHGYSRPMDKQFQPEPEDGDIVWPSTLVFLDRIPWIKPPPIVAAATTGPWSRFSVVTLDVDESHPLHDREIMQERGNKYTGDCDSVGPYYDRQNKRQLYFPSCPAVKGHVSDKAFGRPVPFYHFVGPNRARGVPSTVRRSEWMYYEREPQRSDKGREAISPDADALEVFPSLPSDPYMDDGDDEDDVGFALPPASQSIPMPASPPASETMDQPGAIEDIETEFLPIVTSYRPPPPKAGDIHDNALSVSTADSACHSSVSYVSGASPEIGSDSDMHVDEPQSPWRVANYAVVDSNVAKEILSPPSTQSSTDSMECSNQVIDRPISPLLTESSSVGATSLPVPSVTSASNPDEQSRSSSPPPGREDTAAASPAQVDSTRSAPVSDSAMHVDEPQSSWRAANCAVVDSNVTEEILSPPSTQSSTDSMECSNQVIDRPTFPSLTESCSVGATSLPVLSITSASNPDEQSRSSSPPPGREDTAAASPAQADSTRSAPVAEPSSRPHSPAVSTSIPRTSPADVTLTPNHGPERTSRRRQRQHNYAGYQIRMAQRQTRHAQNEPAESANGLSLASCLSEPRQPTGSHYGQSRHHNHQVGPRDSRLPRSSSHRR